MLKCMIIEGGESICANLAPKYGGIAPAYNIRGSRFGKKVAEGLGGINPCLDGDKERYFPIPFVGRHVI